MITGKTVLAFMGALFIMILIGAILGTAAELFDEWRSGKDD